MLRTTWRWRRNDVKRDEKSDGLDCDGEELKED